MKYWYLYIIIILGVALLAAVKQVDYANERWLTAEANIKNYDGMLASSENSNAVLQLTVDQLNYFKDSILTELNATRKELGVRDKNLKVLQSVSSSFSKSDTIILRDTLFKEASLAIDTVLGDNWYSVRLGLKYPSMVTVEPYFKSEKHIVVSSKKETVNPPKKFFFLRWLQKKHTILHVDVVEQNPYVENESSRYVEVVK